MNQLKVKNENYNNAHNVVGIPRTRKNVRENFAYSMLLGVEEARERNDLDKIKGVEEAMDREQVMEHCYKVGTQIESGMWALYGGEKIVRIR